METIFIHLIVILLLSQLYANFALLKLHYLAIFFISSLSGIIYGIYLSFKTDCYVKPDLKSDQIVIHSNKLFNFRFYSNLVFYLNSYSKQTNRTLSDILRKSTNEKLIDDKTSHTYSDLDDELDYETDSLQMYNSLIDEHTEDETKSSSKIDIYLDDVLNLIVKDFIMVFLGNLFWDKDKFFLLVKNELKQLITCLRKKMRHLDAVKLISSDLINYLTAHLFQARKYSANGNKFRLNSFEIDPNKESDHLRNLIEVLLLHTFSDSKTYFKNDALRALIREILLNKVLQPTIELICDPDYLNQNLLNYLEKKEKVDLELASSFSRTRSYEDYIRQIKSFENIDEIKQTHLKIVNDLIFSTFIINKMSENNPNLNTGANNNTNAIINSGLSSFYASFSDLKDLVDIEQQPMQYKPQPSLTSSEKNTKAELLRSRDLKVYIKQLTFAKNLCERRLIFLSGSSTNVEDETHEVNIENKINCLKNPLPFETVIKSPKGQKLFLKFLEPDGSDALLRFCIDVDKMKHKSLNMRKKYELANKIFENYLKSYDSPVRDEIEKTDLVKSMKLFLVGNSSDDAFFIAQSRIKNVLESNHYPSFLTTDVYLKLSKELNLEIKEEKNELLPSETDTKSTVVLRRRTETANGSDRINMSMDKNKKRKEDLKKMVQIKMSALNAIKSDIYRQESETKVIDKLEFEIKTLKQDLSMLQTHERKTQEYINNIGNWHTHVLKAIHFNDKNNPSETNTSNDKTTLFEIQVQLYEENTNLDTPNETNIKEGWFIHRSFKQFETLYESLHDATPSEINNILIKLPKIKRQLTSKSISEEKLKNIVKTLDSYLKEISRNEKLGNSEALYSFLCPTADHYKQNNDKSQISTNDEKFSLTSLFRISKPAKETEEDELVDELFADNTESKDSTAEPFYLFLEELFELKGMKKLFRKSLIMFVQLTYGATINKTIRESIYWLLGEENMSSYIKKLKDSFWTYNKELKEYKLINRHSNIRTNEEKAYTKIEAKKKLLNNIPNALQKLVGEKNAQNGLNKLFELLQDKKLNKHLVYTLIELFIDELCKENKIKTS